MGAKAYNAKGTREFHRRISILVLIGAIVTELIACILWMIPISGVFIYLAISGFALLLSVICWIAAKDYKGVRVLAGILFIVLIITILLDLLFVIEIMGML